MEPFSAAVITSLTNDLAKQVVGNLKGTLKTKLVGAPAEQALRRSLGVGVVALIAQATAAQYLKAGRMPGTLANVRRVYAERARVMCDTLRQELGAAIEFVQPQGGLFVWARLTGAGGKVSDGGEFAKRAIEKGVAFVPGAPFFCANPDPSTLRLSFATVGADKIVEGVGRLAQAL